MKSISQHFEAQITQTAQLDYLLYLPAGYDDDPAQRWPLIVFLHGGGACGSDLELVRRGGIPYNLEHGQDLPFIVLAPQCPADSHWTLHVEALHALIGEVIARNRADETRVYLTGASLGAAGTWMLAGAYPARFAAIAPIAGRAVPLPLPRFKDLPTWVFHGEADELMPVSETYRTVDALKAVGADV